MGLRGPKPKGKVNIKWSANLAYAVGLLVTDGSLSKDGRHIDFTSKDLEQVNTYIKCLDLKDIKVGEKKSGEGNLSFRVQIGDVLFYKFLCSIGLMPNKTKVVSEIKVPKKYYVDFLRGCFDGDGSSYSYFDKRWKSSFMFYVSFVSASKKHIDWIQKQNQEIFKVDGYLTKVKDKDFYQLRYAKKDGVVIANKMYYNASVPCLERKKDKLFSSIKISAQVLKLVYKHA